MRVLVHDVSVLIHQPFQFYITYTIRNVSRKDKISFFERKKRSLNIFQIVLFISDGKFLDRSEIIDEDFFKHIPLRNDEIVI